MKKKVGTFKIWLLAIAAVVAFSLLPKVSSLATEDQALVVKENKQEAADAAGDESSAENMQETAGEGANLEAQGLEIPVSKVKVSETIKHRLAYSPLQQVPGLLLPAKKPSARQKTPQLRLSPTAKS